MRLGVLDTTDLSTERFVSKQARNRSAARPSLFLYWCGLTPDLVKSHQYDQCAPRSDCPTLDTLRTSTTEPPLAPAVSHGHVIFKAEPKRCGRSFHQSGAFVYRDISSPMPRITASARSTTSSTGAMSSNDFTQG